MLDFLLLVLAMIGFSHILVDGSIMVSYKQELAKPKWQDVTWRMLPPWRWFFEDKTWRPYEKILEILNCYQCSGVYAGIVSSLIMYVSNNFEYFFWLKFLLFAFAASFLSPLGAVVIGYFNSVNNR